MKRQLLESVKVFPYALGEAVDRMGSNSAVLGVRVTDADDGAVAKITVTHSDAEDGAFETVEDNRIFLDRTLVERDGKGLFVEASAEVAVKAGELINLDVDLIGCKQYVKFNVAYTGTVEAGYAVVIGDNAFDPLAH